MNAPEHSDTGILSDEQLSELAPAGYHIALRIGFAFPLVEINEWPQKWVAHYTEQRFTMRDPVMRWVYAETGTIRWADLLNDDPYHVIRQAAAFGLRHGAAVSVKDKGDSALRSFGVFARVDRDFQDEELTLLSRHVAARHEQLAPPSNLTAAELEALSMMREGLRQKEIAYQLGVTEGAVKQRLRSAKKKLGAQTAAQAAAMALDFGLI